MIGFVGSLKPWHGVSKLLDAFATARDRNPQLELKIIGSGPEEQNLQNQVAALPAPAQAAIDFLGQVDHRQLPQWLATFDIAVAPYPELNDFYFSPLKILEYMAAGCAVIASDIGQIPELIEHQSTGLLVAPGCTAELATAILKLSHDPETRRNIGQAARAFAQSHHSWNQVVDRILATLGGRQPCEIVE